MKNQILAFSITGLLIMGTAAYADSTKIQNPTNKHWYKRFDLSMSWHAARDYCQQQGGYLTTLTSEDESQFVYNQLVFLSPNQGSWIGLTDEGVERQYKWITGEPFVYSNWGAGEPNNCQDIEDYGMMFSPMTDPRASFWNDVGSLNTGSCGCSCPSDKTNISFVCEWSTRVAGTITIQGIARQGRIVTLKQKDEPDQNTYTDGEGHFQFENAASGKTGNIFISLPKLP